MTQTTAPSQEAGLLELAQELLQLEDLDQMLDAVMRHSLRLLEADRGFVVLKRSEGYDFKVIRNWRREELEGGGEPVSRSIVARVLAGGKPVVIEDALSDERFAKEESVLRMGIRSVLAAPLEDEGRARGVIYLESSTLSRLFGSRHLSLFQRILEISQRALERSIRQLALQQRLSLLEKDFLARHEFPGIITADEGFIELLKQVAQVAKSDLPILVEGDSGTGKELIIRALHLNSPRAQGAYVPVNCAAIAPELIESALFGHLKGSFTSADRANPGLIASADGGTVFLDEVGELPQAAQAKLLRTLQFGEIQPVGAVRPLTVDVRFLAATNRDLEAEVAAGNFREDLLYRLNVVTLQLPPLRDRPNDILPLFYHFLKRTSQRAGRTAPEVSPRLERVLQQHAWPGNVRELENEVSRLVAVTPEGEPLLVDRLSPRLLKALFGDQPIPTETAPEPARQSTDPELEDRAPTSLAEHEKELIEHTLRAEGYNKTRAAKRLGISREGLRKKMKRLGMEPEVETISAALKQHRGDARLAAAELGMSLDRLLWLIERLGLDPAATPPSS